MKISEGRLSERRAEAPEQDPERDLENAIRTYIRELIAQYTSVHSSNERERLIPDILLNRTITQKVQRIIQDAIESGYDGRLVKEAEEGILPRRAFAYLVDEFMQQTTHALETEAPEKDALVHLGDMMLRGTEAPFYSLTITEKFRTMASAMKYPKITDWTGLIGMDFIEQLQVGSDIEKIVATVSRWIEKQPVSSQLDGLHTIELLLGNARENVRRQAVEVMMQSLQQLTHTARPFVRYAAAADIAFFRQKNPGEYKRHQVGHDLPIDAEGTIPLSREYRGVPHMGTLTTVRLNESSPGESLEKVLNTPQHLPFDMQEAPEELATYIRELHRPHLRVFVEKTLNIPLPELSLRSQVQLLSYISQQDNGTLQRIEVATHQPNLHVKSFLESFFSLNHRSENADLLLRLANEYPAEYVNEVCGVYTGIMEQLNTIEQRAQEFFGTGDRSVDTRRIVQVVLERAQRILNQASAIDPSDTVTQAMVIEQLHHIQKDVVLFASFCQTVFKETDTPMKLEDIAQLSLERQTIQDLSPTQKQELRAMVGVNYKDKKYFRDQFETLLSQPTADQMNDQFILLQRKGSSPEIIGCVRVHPLSDDRAYVGSLHIHPQMQQAGISEQFTNTILRELDKEYSTLEATVYIDHYIMSQYIEELGFKATGMETDGKNNTQHPGLFTIVRFAEQPPSQLAKRPIAELQEMYQTQLSENNPSAHIGEPIIVASYTLPDEVATLRQVAGELLNQQGYVITRTVCMDGACRKRFYAFERFSNASHMNRN